MKYDWRADLGEDRDLKVKRRLTKALFRAALVVKGRCPEKRLDSLKDAYIRILKHAAKLKWIEGDSGANTQSRT